MLLLNIDEAFTNAYPEQHDLIYNISRESIASELEIRGFYRDANSFRDCHTEFFVMSCPDCGFQYPVPVRCNFRLCPTCGKKRCLSLSLFLVRKVLSVQVLIKMEGTKSRIDL